MPARRFALLLSFLVVSGWLYAPAECIADDPADGQAQSDTTAAPAQSEIAARREQAFQQQVRPLVNRYCASCHSGNDAESGVRLDDVASAEMVLDERRTWLKVLEKLRAEEMPPEDADDHPSKEERLALVTWVDEALNKIDCSGTVNPGHVTIRRLNRNEYRNTIRDLVGVDYKPADDFPADDLGYGFDTIGDVLSLPPILMEKYLDAAQEIAAQAIVVEHPQFVDRKFTGAELGGRRNSESGRALDNGGRILASEGEMSTRLEFPADGEYVIRVRAYGDQAGDEPARMSIRLENEEIKLAVVEATESEPGEYECRLRTTAGRRRVGLAFVNDYYQPDQNNPQPGDRNLIVQEMQISGPFSVDASDFPASHCEILFVMPGGAVSVADAARQVMRRMASRAFRRPATQQEIDRLAKIVETVTGQGESFEAGVQVALMAVLVSPHFLYKVEMPPDNVGAVGIFALNDFELATNLSYFLWSSMPDDELFEVALKGELHNDDVLEGQVRRMLADPKSDALIENFAGQWLQLRNLDMVMPDKGQFPDFDEDLRAAMRTETEMLFEAVVREDRSLLDLLGADFTFVNERLARHYGIPDVSGPEFRRVSLSGTNRRGLLGQASFLTVTSNPTRTSPVKRGKWVLENLLNDPPPPPAPDVPALDSQTELTGTLRQKMEQHRKDARCAVCHQKMDPLGFALENFDAIGAWRTTDGDAPIDASGELPSGEKFSGPGELAELLLSSKKQEFIRCVAEKSLTYALGRGLEYYDRCAVDDIVAAWERRDYRFSALAVEICKSEPFRKRRESRSTK